MTTPVEADINPGKMRFFVGEQDAEKPRPNTSAITTRELEPITVVAIGIRGSYEENFTENKTALLMAERKPKLRTSRPLMRFIGMAHLFPGF